MNHGLTQNLASGLKSGLNPTGAGRVWAESAAQFLARYPDIAPPTTINAMQDDSSPALDGVGGVDLSLVSTPAFGVTGESGRLAVEIDSALDQIRAPAGTDLNPDGAKDMTYLLRTYLPAYSATTPAIMSKRGGTGFAGFSIFMNSNGSLGVVQDGGASGRQDFTVTGDYQDQWIDLAYIIDRGTGLGRVETASGTTTKTLSGIASLGSTERFTFGRSAGEGRSALVGVLLSYFIAWDGTALTREEFLEITAP